MRSREYEIDDPTRPGYAQHHRLLTMPLDLVCLDHERWEVEFTLDEIDTHQRLPPRPLRSLPPGGVIPEWYALLIAHCVVRALMHQAALAHDLNPDRLSFVNALRLIADAIPEFRLVDPADHPRLWTRLLRAIAHSPLPEREHCSWPQPSKDFRHALVLPEPNDLFFPALLPLIEPYCP